jgi:trehalose/maltose transport system permease protein
MPASNWWTFQEVGYGSAASTLLFLTIAILTIAYDLRSARSISAGRQALMPKIVKQDRLLCAGGRRSSCSRCFPFYYAILSSFRIRVGAVQSELLAEEFSMANYVSVFAEQPFARNILNSVVVATVVVGLSLFLGVTAAYALGRVQFRGRAAALLTILGVSMFPQVAVLSGMFELIRFVGIYNSLPGLILANMILTLPFTVWVLTTFMRDLPKELEEAAYVDGASSWVVVAKVFLPLMWPALVTTGLLAFIAAWNEFLFALTFTLSNEMRTVPVAIALLTGASSSSCPGATSWPPR